jgi:hypothetical protein
MVVDLSIIIVESMTLRNSIPSYLISGPDLNTWHPPQNPRAASTSPTARQQLANLNSSAQPNKAGPSLPDNQSTHR